MTRLASLLATAFGIGSFPKAPGTAASLVALPFGWVLIVFGNAAIFLASVLVVSVVGVWAADRHGKNVGLLDPSDCVIDEVAGQWLALLPLMLTAHINSPLALALAFLLFRFFDIVKPWPIAPLERLPGGIGVMADDIAAGLVSAAILAGAIYANWI